MCFGGQWGCYGVCLQWLRTNVKPPVKTAHFEKIVSLVNHIDCMGGLAFTNKTNLYPNLLILVVDLPLLDFRLQRLVNLPVLTKMGSKREGKY